jgi:hypothetical protein
MRRDVLTPEELAGTPKPSFDGMLDSSSYQ